MYSRATGITDPSHPHATGVAINPALLFFLSDFDGSDGKTQSEYSSSLDPVIMIGILVDCYDHCAVFIFDQQILA